MPFQTQLKCVFDMWILFHIYLIRPLHIVMYQYMWHCLYDHVMQFLNHDIKSLNANQLVGGYLKMI